jgi:hypothetical protein
VSGETLTDASKRLELDAYDQALAVRFRDRFADGACLETEPDAG